MRSSILATIPAFRQRIIPEPRVPSRGSQARGMRLEVYMLGGKLISIKRLIFRHINFELYTRTNISNGTLACVSTDYS
jgi:hypothetical protein